MYNRKRRKMYLFVGKVVKLRRDVLLYRKNPEQIKKKGTAILATPSTKTKLTNTETGCSEYRPNGGTWIIITKREQMNLKRSMALFLCVWNEEQELFKTILLTELMSSMPCSISFRWCHFPKKYLLYYSWCVISMRNVLANSNTRLFSFRSATGLPIHLFHLSMVKWKSAHYFSIPFSAKNEPISASFEITLYKL